MGKRNRVSLMATIDVIDKCETCGCHINERMQKVAAIRFNWFINTYNIRPGFSHIFIRDYFKIAINCIDCSITHKDGTNTFLK